MLARGHGDTGHKREARRLRGLVEQYTSSGLGSQLTRYQVRVLQVRARVRVLNLYLNLNT
jgi:hypothetical protein